MSTVIRMQEEIRVFANDHGGISIEMIDSNGNSSFVWFWAEHAAAIADAINAVRVEIQARDDERQQLWSCHPAPDR